MLAHFLAAAAAAAALALASSHSFLVAAKSLSKTLLISSGLKRDVFPSGPSEKFLLIYGPTYGCSPFLNCSRMLIVLSGVKSYKNINQEYNNTS